MNFSSFRPLDEATLLDRIEGCWMGKNVGGTLGGPWEKGLGEAEPFAVTGYNGDVTGGLPNDDLELQLVWLRAIEERGVHLRAEDFVPYWLHYIGYNPDEYGWAKTNLRRCLPPPLSGSHDNPGKHSMGSPIRSELWACLAAGNPRLAVRYATEDALVDHAGGEGLLGSMFNAALQSAAFVLSDRDALLDLALAYIPTDCLTARCVRAARSAHASGADWREARRRVIAEGGSWNAQFAATNLGLQTVGWLYGRDFGDTLLLTVNCGFDTDCTGATLGATLGIIAGARALPEEWLRPLGRGIKVNKGIADRPTLPADIDELTRRVLAVRRRVLAEFGPPPADPAELLPDDTVRAQWNRAASTVTYRDPAGRLHVTYHGSPTYHPGATVHLSVAWEKERGVNPSAQLELNGPEGWSINTRSSADGTLDAVVTVPASDSGVGPRTVWIEAMNTQLPASPRHAVRLLADRPFAIWWSARPRGDWRETPPTWPSPIEAPNSTPRLETWQLHYAPEQVLSLPWPAGATHAYFFTGLFVQHEIGGRIIVHSDSPRRAWLNSQLLGAWPAPRTYRPYFLGEDCVFIKLLPGWTPLFIEVERVPEAERLNLQVHPMHYDHLGLHEAHSGLPRPGS